MKIKYESLTKVDKSVVKEMAALLEQLNPDFKPPVRLKEIKKVVDFPGSKLFVARNSKNKIIGMVTLIGYPQVEGLMKVWIEDLIVEKDYRRQGIGKKLLELAKTEAKNLGYKTIVFTSRSSRKEANTFYKNMGFTIKETNYYRLDLKD